MKQIGLLLLCVLSWLLAGCTADPLPAPDGAAGDPVPKNPHAVPIEQALADLRNDPIAVDATESITPTDEKYYDMTMIVTYTYCP